MADVFGLYCFADPTLEIETAWARLVATAYSPVNQSAPVLAAMADDGVSSANELSPPERHGRGRSFITSVSASPWVTGTTAGTGDNPIALTLLDDGRQADASPAVKQQRAQDALRWVAAGRREIAPALDGAWLCVAHDHAAETLTLVRSRDGAPPLYYFVDGETLWFGTRLPTLRRLPRFPAKPDGSAISYVLGYGFPPLEATLFRGVKRLHPGGMLRLTPNGIEERTLAGDDAPTARPTSSDPIAAFERAVVAELSRSVAGKRVAILGADDDPGTQWLRRAAQDAGASPIARPAADPDSMAPGALDILHRAIAGDGEVYAWPALIDLVRQAASWGDAAEACLCLTGSSMLVSGAPRHQRFRRQLIASGAAARQKVKTNHFFETSAQLVRDIYFDQIAFFNDKTRFALTGPLLAQWNVFSMADELGATLETATAESAVDLAFAVDDQMLPDACLRPLVGAAGRAAGVPMLAPFLAQPVRDHVRVMMPDDQGALARMLAPWQAEDTPAVSTLEDFVRGDQDAVRDLLQSPSFMARGLFGRLAVNNLLDNHFRAIARRAPLLWAMSGLELWFRDLVDSQR